MNPSARNATGRFPLIWHGIFDLNMMPINASRAVLSRPARSGSPQNSRERIIWRKHTFSARAEVSLITNACANSDWNGLATARFSTREERPARLYGWTSHSHENLDRSYAATT